MAGVLREEKKRQVSLGEIKNRLEQDRSSPFTGSLYTRRGLCMIVERQGKHGSGVIKLWHREE